MPNVEYMVPYIAPHIVFSHTLLPMHSKPFCPLGDLLVAN